MHTMLVFKKKVGKKLREFRIDIEEHEKAYLSPYAALSINSKSCEHPRDKDAIRTIYMQDRDRVIHSQYFRRLKDKAQVIMLSMGDFRTRLTHTLEVTQISKTIGKALRLNEDLIEAIALGHDLGHTPFGHAGERAIRKYIPDFHHATHSLRVVEKLEAGHGLNLSFETREGIVGHTKGKNGSIIDKSSNITLEAQIVRVCDCIAYINHDIDDAIKYNLLKENELPSDIVGVLGTRHSERINTMALSVIEHSMHNDYIDMGVAELEATNALRDFMFQHVYFSDTIQKDTIRVQKIIETLFDYFLEHLSEIDNIPNYHAATDYKSDEQKVKDFIAYLTDSDALKYYDIISCKI